jgi:hypothetical protein
VNRLRRWCLCLTVLASAFAGYQPVLGADDDASVAEVVVDPPAIMADIPITDAPMMAMPAPLGCGLISHRYRGDTSCVKGEAAFCCTPACNGLFAGADYLLVRPTWSEAVAFARGVQTATSFATRAEPISFDYDSSFRVFAGWRPTPGPAEIRFTYTYLQGKVDIGGTAGGPGQFIVDPFGNIVGTVQVIDPSDARSASGPITGGDRIDTHTSVEVNVFDINFGSAAPLGDSCWAFAWDTGIRIADVKQYYDSVVTANGALASRGVFTADFSGAGPRLGGEFRRVGPCFAFYLNAHGSLLLGDYNVASAVNPMPVFTASQDSSMTRLIPVLESEIGVHWQAMPRTVVSAGWLFQTWLDLGTSGGTFGGFFNGADDANVMSFDGLFVRAEYSF